MLKVEIALGSQQEVAIIGGAMLQIAALREGKPMLGTAVTATESPQADPPAAAPEKAPCTPCEEKKRGRGKKAPEAPAEVVGAIAPATEVPAVEVPKVEAPKVDVQALFAAYLAKHQIAKTRELLERYGSKRLGEVPAEKLAALIAELQAGVA